MAENLRDEFKVSEIVKKYPMTYNECMNTVLIQELNRYNKLISAVKSTILQLVKTLNGLLLMTPEMEQMQQSISTNSVPDLWSRFAYPSLKPLTSWYEDLQKRLKMFSDWISEGEPNAFWLPGFFFTQSFLTGVKQGYARAQKCSIDKVAIRFTVQKSMDLKKPQNGCVVHGLFLEGGGWNLEDSKLREAKPKELTCLMPPILFEPIQDSGKFPAEDYECPVYKTSARRGILSTTGHSTNFI